MSSCLNHVQLIGHVGKELEVLKATSNGSFVRVSLATSKTYTSDEGVRKEIVEWHTVFFNKRLGSIAEKHLSKGAYIYVAGELRTTSWQDKEKQKRYTTAVYASDLKFLDKKSVQKASEKPSKSEATSEELSSYAEYPEADD